MPPRTLASLAHALGAAPEVDAAFAALAEALADLDRGATLALLTHDERRGMLRERITFAASDGSGVVREALDASLEHLPGALRAAIASGGRFVELGDRSGEIAALIGMPVASDGVLSLRGLRIDGALPALLALAEPRRFFGTRVVERLLPAVALFELGFARLWEREAREEAVRTLEDVTQRVHASYVRRLAELEQTQATTRSGGAPGDAAESATPVAAERAATQQRELVRRAERRADRLESQLASLTAQSEQVQLDSLRRSEALRQTERTLHLLDRVLSLDAVAHEPRQLVDGLLALVGNEMQAQRCSLMLRAPEPGTLYLAAARGLAPHIADGVRVALGEGVAGRVAQSREPLLVRDVRRASTHPLLHDQYFTSGSFISFPLVYHDELVGVVNVTNRAGPTAYTEEDVERVRLLALVIALVATHAQLPERLLDVIAVA